MTWYVIHDELSPDCHLELPDGTLWKYNGFGYLRRWHPGSPPKLCIDGRAYTRRWKSRRRRGR
jgi:hypothetical protein